MKKLLIANRGEIAIRIARTAAEMGITSVGVYTEDDAASLHVRRADETAKLPGKGARGYLDIEAVVAAAKAAGADAVHPGYGFLSESADFAEAVETAGMDFIGPAPETLRQLGDKTEAVALARSLDVPTLFEGDGAVSVDEVKAAFKAVPEGGALIVKAVSGGGGRGVRIIRDEAEIDSAFERAASEAKASFGNSALYVERFLENARHIEVQIMGDGTGAVTHFYDRDCTLQRRHQKLIEIAPAPFLSNAVREQIFDYARRIGAHVSYRGAGTIEFMIDPTSDEIFFIEANARLQVEHTVTEAILGIDLVRLQIEIAKGRSLEDMALTQSELHAPDGFGIQARVCLETMQADGSVRPSGGALDVYTPPSGPGIRVDDYGYAGYKTSPHYDSLIAKVIAHSPKLSYEDTLRRLSRALGEFEIRGAKTNIATLRELLGDDRVHSGDIHTRFIDEHAGDFTGASETEEDASPAPEPVAPKGGESGASPESKADTEHTVRAPLSGVLVSFAVEAGDAVGPGKTVAILEAMKMEHEVRAETSGTIVSLLREPGDTIVEGAPLAAYEPGKVSAGEEASAEAIDLDSIRPDLQRALDRKSAGHDENRPEAVKKRHKRGHRTARENITDLCDPGTFHEYGSLVLAAQRRRRDLDDLIANTTGDGMVCGIGHVNGDLFPEDKSRVMAMSYDYMVLAGTQGALNHYKKDRMFEIAETQRLPVVLYAEGGGGRPGDTDPMGVAGLDCLAFNYFAKLSGLVPSVGIVNGRCFAGNAVLLGCCDVIIATKSANIGIGGPAMIEGGGLGVFKPEEVGPVEDQVPSGVIDILVEDEAEATAAAKKYLSYFQGPVEDWKAPDERALRFAVPEQRKRVYEMRDVIGGIADVNSVLELRPDFGVGIYTAFIRVEGRPLGLIANNPKHLSGAIDAPGSDKAARFLQLCDAFDLPVVSLVDCPGIMVGPEIEKTGLVRHASRLMVVGANITTPLMTFIIRKGYGLGAQAMAGGSFKAPLFCLSWPTGEFGGMGLEGAVKLGYRKELEAIEAPAERQKTYEEMVARMYERGSAINMASHFEIDDVIDPADTRRWIMAGLKSIPPAPVRTGKKRPNVDTW